jgi:hypothetical protein
MLISDLLIAAAIGFVFLIVLGLSMDRSETGTPRMAPIRVPINNRRRKLPQNQQGETVPVYRLDLLLWFLIGFLLLGLFIKTAAS